MAGGAALLSEGKKKRGGLRLLSRVEVSELRLQKTADPPRPFQLRPVPQISALGSGRGTSTPALFIDVFRPSGFACSRLHCRRFPRLAPFPPLGSFRLAPSLPWNLPPPKRFPVPTFRRLRCFRSFDFPRLAPFSVSGLSRLSPPGVYLQGSRFPFESPSLVRPVSCRARSGRHAQYHVSIRFPLSATLHNAFRRVGRPAGGFCLTGSSGYTSNSKIVKPIFGQLRGSV